MKPSALHSELSGGSAPTCLICEFLATLSPETAAEWQKELGLPVKVIRNVAVVNALSRRGVDLTEASVRRHRSRHVAR